MTLRDLIEENVKKYGEYPFLYYGDKVYSNLDVKRQAIQLNGALQSRGIGKGDKVLVCMPNCPEVIISYQGIVRSGATAVPVMFLLHPHEIAYILQNSEAKAVITSTMILPKIQEAVAGLEQKPLIYVVGQATQGDVLGFHDELAKIDPEQPENLPEIDENDVAVLLYTSGTTGKPKGVMLTHKNLYSNAANSIKDSDQEERGTTLGVLPLAHVYGFTVTSACFLLGASIVVFSKFDVDEVFAAIEKHKVKTFSAVPAMIHAMVTSPNADKYDLSSLESVGSGSAPLPDALRVAFKQKFGAEVLEGYGLSEAAPVVASQKRGEPIKPGSVGKPIHGVEVKVVDDQGNELPPNEVGELVVRGDNITPGYFKNEEATREVLKDGWLHTGDMAKIDEDGYIYIVDRKKDLIIRGGFNIYPRDLEELLVKHPAVMEASVIGVPSERMGEEVVAYVVKKPGVEVTEEELIAYCQEHLAKYKTPRRVLFIDEMPRNGVGKILKTELREMAKGVDLGI